MNTYQKAKRFLFSTVKGRFLIGRKLVLNFPTSLDGRVSIIALPDWRQTSFLIKKGEKLDYTLVMNGPDNETFELASFENEEDARSALGHVRRKFTRPSLTIIKWLAIFIAFAIMAEWLVHSNAIRGGGALSSVSSQQGAALRGLPPVPNLDQLKALQAAKGGAGLPNMPAPIAGIPQVPAAGGAGNQSPEEIQALIKKRYNVDLATVPGGLEALRQVTTQGSAGGAAPASVGGVPQAQSSGNDVKATINLLEQSK